MKENQSKTTSCLKRKTIGNFTLIELLIVVAIIAILASILLPALTSALNKSRAITCLSGMKQLGLATQFYLDSHKDTIFVMTSDWEYMYFNTYRYSNLSQIPRDAAGVKNRVCKKDIGVFAWVPRKNICSLVAEARHKGNPNDSSRESISLCSATESCSGHLQYYMFYGMVMGSNKTLTNGTYDYHKTSRLRQASGSMFWSEGSSQIEKSSALGNLSKDNSALGYWRHLNRTNVLFFDGHAGSVGTQQTVCTDSYPSKESLKECASCHFWFPYVK